MPYNANSMIDLLNRLSNNYLGFLNNYNDLCKVSLDTNPVNITDTKFISLINNRYNPIKLNILGKLEKNTHTHDIDGYILHYSFNLYKSVNSYLNLVNNNLLGDNFSKYSDIFLSIGVL